MTRDEFIDGYVSRSNKNYLGLERTPDGYRWGHGPNQRKVALPCACGDDKCQGWAMVSVDPEMLEDHMLLYAPRPPEGKGEL
jgi:hypothetical protein